MRLIVEQSAYSGVIKIAEKIAKDAELVTGRKTEYLAAENITEDMLRVPDELTVVAATIGKSAVLEKEEIRRRIPLDQIEGKRECYCFAFPEKKDSENPHLLVIAGSDKRGTIYGLFHLSEQMGVSPFVDWCGIKPCHRDKIILAWDMECVSKEPSVEYRGFFINDEWPAFGNWCMHHFGGFGADMYEHIFELLLRLKGNYLWPAMWSARFEDDGPGLKNAILADEYGVIMGMSHHEPCLRQGEEYKYLRGKGSVYGDAWNFRTNRDGIIRFWEDGLKRSGQFENVITVGMRGEADTAILGENAAVADNIALLREVLRVQNLLIRENVNKDLEKVPRMLALYKEVEEFFYGTEDTAGLLKEPELEDIILMLCDDNYGNLRTLPTEEMRKHKGGYGMYYHLDYHGWPVSYEWINSSYLPKIWEQMSMAYDFGVRRLWMVNVGDIATQELPLSFLMDMAYDFERFGSRAVNCVQEYVRQWVRRSFDSFSEETRQKIAEILNGYTKVIHRRRPEALGADTYHPVNEEESERILSEADDIIKKAEGVRTKLKCESADNQAAFAALIYYPAVATMNLVKMQVFTGLNHYYAGIGAAIANDYGKEAAACFSCDRKLTEWYHQLDGQRWYGMGASQHIGFTHWNEDECQNPVIMQVLLLDKPSVIVAVNGTSQHAEGSMWLDNRMILENFRNPECMEAYVTVYGRSKTESHFSVKEKTDWIKTDVTEGSVDGILHKKQTIKITIDEGSFLQDKENVSGTLVIETPAGQCEIEIPVNRKKYLSAKNVFEDTAGYISIEAEHFYDAKPGAWIKNPDGESGFGILQGYGKTLSAVKYFPSTAYFSLDENAPYLEYRFMLREGGTYEIEFYLQPSNPVTRDNEILYGVQMNEAETVIYNEVDRDYRIGDREEAWSKGVLEQIRKQCAEVVCQKGENALRIYPLTPGFVLEKFVIYPKGYRIRESYLGPAETFHT